ncbi:hypothetical protein, partial [Klebsiella pneumoniae]|uniref:hypothetical protein n=1 Tax=Klebsiella pneumoniae TaxID=573 RepID=UPI001C4DDF41
RPGCQKACVLPENPASYRVVRKKSYLFIDGRLLFAKLNMLWWLYWSSIAAIDPDFAEVM